MIKSIGYDNNDLSVNRDENAYNRLGVERCELKNGKILWLCKNHIKETQASILSNNYSNNTSAISESNQK
jgi:hypothetical protein